MQISLIHTLLSDYLSALKYLRRASALELFGGSVYDVSRYDDHVITSYSIHYTKLYEAMERSPSAPPRIT